MVIEAFRRPSVNLFDGLDHHVVSEILEQAQTQRLPPETLLFSEGEPARALHVLISGFVKMAQTTPNGERVITRYVKPGEAFGTPALLGGFYPADAVTATHCIELQWLSPTARSLAVRHPSVALKAIGDLEARLRDMESRLIPSGVKADSFRVFSRAHV